MGPPVGLKLLLIGRYCGLMEFILINTKAGCGLMEVILINTKAGCGLMEVILMRYGN